MKKNFMTALTIAAAVLLSAPAHAAQPVSYHTYHYTCQGGKKLTVQYVNFGKTSFAVLNYAGGQYGLAQATSASGARYASLGAAGPFFNGLEWWEWHGKADLNAFTGSDTGKTRNVLRGCVTRG